MRQTYKQNKEKVTEHKKRKIITMKIKTREKTGRIITNERLYIRKEVNSWKILKNREPEKDEQTRTLRKQKKTMKNYKKNYYTRKIKIKKKRKDENTKEITAQEKEKMKKKRDEVKEKFTWQEKEKWRKNEKMRIRKIYITKKEKLKKKVKWRE